MPESKVRSQLPNPSKLFDPFNTSRSAHSLLILAALVIFSATSFAATYIVSTTADSGGGSLRQAISDANGNSGLDSIIFQISGAGVHTITPGSALPPITDPVIIDGTTQPGFAGLPLIEINGSSAGANAGLRLIAGNSTVQGLCINRFAADGIRIETAGSNLIRNNFLGTDPTGLLSRANTNGIFINGTTSNLIGGTNTSDANLISGNFDSGIYLWNGGANVIVGNFIGTAFGGAADLGNLNNGIVVNNSAANQLGDSTAGARNIISGNDASGIYLMGPGASGNLIQGNYVGTDISGTLAISNLADGISVQAPANTIGGTGPGAGNVISGNGKAGIYLNGSSSANNIVQGNFIGTGASGLVGVPNAYAGITISAASGNLIGGASAGARNVIAANKQDGIFITSNASGNTIAGNYIGVDSTGSNGLANLYNGISISAANSNYFGGNSAGARNLISGNANHGVQIYSGSQGNLIQGNYIGANASGQLAISNKLCGIRIESAANTIGGASSGAGNLISGNGQDGITIVGGAASGNLMQGNLIGTRADGLSALKNLRAGIGISGAPGNVVGGANPGAGNLLSGNGDAGIYIISNAATANQVLGNTIGADITGTAALGNTREGVYLERALTNTIGGSTPGSGNLISANRTRGIFVTNSSWNTIQGNLIGTKIDGVSGLGNVFHAVEVEAGGHNNTIGGSAAAAGNRIGFSQTVYAGVRIRDGSTNNIIRANSIFSSGAQGIDLSTVGVAINDACDLDSGGNMLQNYPVLSQAYGGTSVGIRGSINSKAGETFLLQFFANPACDSSGYGEGQIYLGDKTVVTTGACSNGFLATFASPVPVGYVVTATATDSSNNTSEFSACLAVAAPPVLDISQPNDQQVRLAWPSSTGGFVLKQTSSLAPPIQWTTVTNAPVVSNGQFVVTLPVAAGGQFYLLSFE